MREGGQKSLSNSDSVILVNHLITNMKTRQTDGQTELTRPDANFPAASPTFCLSDGVQGMGLLESPPQTHPLPPDVATAAVSATR